jgi:putative DNA primase/helicase
MALASMTPEGERRSPEEGWDAADAIKDWTDRDALWDAAKSCVTRCEAGPTYVSWGPYKMSASGLTKRGDNPERPIWISSAFEVAAKSRDARGKNWGKWVRFLDGDGGVHCRHVPDAHMQGDPAIVCGPLADEGLTIGPNGQRDLVAYLAGAKSTTRATVVDRTGWHEVGGRLCFVLPGEIIGPKDAEFVILDDAAVGPYEARGTLEDWQDGVGKMAGEHYLAALAVCGSLAGPLLRAAGQEGGGVHFFFVSSTGKTTLLRLAASAWGRGSSNGYVRGWRATANGLEGAAASANDTVLILDEVGVLEAREASASLYELANGLGKSRMNRDTSLRKTKTWDVFVLSSGEIAMAAKVAEHGGKKPRAGQEVRMVDVSADRGKGFGAFSHAGTYADAGKLADAMKRAATTNYGTAGPEFVRRIVRFGFGKAGDVTRRRIAEFADANVPKGADGQVGRVANRLGLMAAAGELATELGVTPWRRGLATASAAWAFRKWMAERGGAEAAETRQAVAQVRLFIEQYGDSRFDPLGESEARPANNRAGWRDGTGPSRQWFIPPETWKWELCAGLDPKFVAKTLAARGMLKRAKDGHQSVVKIEGTAKRVYVITARIFDGSADQVE